MTTISNDMNVEVPLEASSIAEQLHSVSDSEEEQPPTAERSRTTERCRAQNAKFSAWLSQRAEKITKDEVQAIVEDTNEETLSVRGLMAKQESNAIINTPREYQLELFERAKKQNIIAVLDTGSGKTLIAVLLLKYVIDQELEHRSMGKKHRVSFFLVDCVTLVFQQYTVLDRNLDQKIAHFCGEMGCDLWSKDTWRSIFTDNMVIVCTAEILNQCLMHSFISIDEINLLIFDEAHHTKKNHAYARIIKDYYVSLGDPMKLPKIFGMTASPVDARVDVITAAKELEAILHCQIATTSDLSLLRNSISRPKEEIAVYKRLCYAYDTPSCSKLKATFGDLTVLSKNFKHAREATSQLGEWCADWLWRFALAEPLSIGKVERKMERNFLRDKEDRPVELLDQEITRLNEAKDVVSRWASDPPTFEGNNLSPKVRLLHRYLRLIFEKPTEAKCIIFVKRRYTARALGQLLKVIGTPHMRLDLLMGSRAGEVGDVRFTFRQQIVTVMKFRKGELNCLIATSIAEEGLDIPECNLVIRFDLYETLIQYIQSRGRARHEQSQYVHMVEDNNKIHYQAVADVRLGEQVMRQFCEALPADRLLQGEDYKLESALTKEQLHRKYVDPDTGATLTYATSLVVLSHFIGCLPHNNENTRQAVYTFSIENKQFVCEVILPENSPVHSAIGKPYPRKSLAKRSAAFEACVLLHERNYIDKHLVSTYHKYLPQMRNAHLALTSKKTKAYINKLKPDLWKENLGSPPERLYLTIIELDSPEKLGRDYQPLALLTRRGLPAFPLFPLHVRVGEISNVVCTSVSRDLAIDAARLNELTEFTLRVFSDVYYKDFGKDVDNMAYWLAPVLKDWRELTLQQSTGQRIDWAAVSYVFNNLELPWSIDTPNDHLVNRYIIDRWAPERFYSIAIEPGLKPRDPVPEGAPPRKQRKSNQAPVDILDYTVSLFRKSRARATWRDDQPVIKVERIPMKLDFHDDYSEQEVVVPTVAYLCPEPLKISALPVSVVPMCNMFAAIIHRLDSYLIAIEAFSVFGLSVRLDLALEAITKDSDNTEEHRAAQIHVRRGMGKNYERLEFYGDCFLKQATSIALFCNSPDDNEFEYHVRRMCMISNKNLLKTAVRLELYKYIRSNPFSRRDWYPRGLKQLTGKSIKVEDREQHLEDKTIADVCEAMIGAALLSFEDSGDMDMAVKAVSALVSNEDHTLSEWKEYYLSYEKPRYQLAQATASQVDLAKQIGKKDDYYFKYPRLLRSAFIHPSYPFAIEKVPCYQRLEFLGDALYDMACIRFLFHQYPDKDPQWLTEHKMAMVGNKFQAALSVRLGFHKHLRSTGAVIEHQNREYVGEIEEAEREANGARDYWIHTKQPPKALSDVLEGYIGALFVDSEFDFKQVERFFDQHVRWFFEDMSIYDTFANNHPTTYLHSLMTLSLGCTNYRLMSAEVPAIVPGGPPTSIAALMVHDQIVAEGQASSSKNAKVKASSAALKELQGLAPFEYRMLYQCDCEGKMKEWVGKDGDGIGMVGTAI